MDKSSPQVKQLLNESNRRLRAAGIKEPRLQAETIIAAALGCPRLELYLRLEETLSPRQLDIIRKGIRRLAAGEPIQYVLGAAEFMGHTFKCDRRALIPRPETEQLVELVLEHKPLWQIERLKIIDIGTGTGCIAISLALSNRRAKYFAVDISARTIELARENARTHGVLDSVTFITTDFSGLNTGNCYEKQESYSAFINPKSPAIGWSASGGKIQNPKSVPPLDAVIANPPYVRAADYRKLPEHIRLWEPRAALEGGKDGLKAIRPLIKQAFQILGQSRWLFMEIGAGQWPAVRRLVLSAGFRQCSVRRDHSGHPRMVIAEK